MILVAFSIWITVVCASLLFFDDSGNLIAHSYSVWGDWSAHFTFINALKERGFHWLGGDNPLFPGIPFQYPFLSHLLTYFFGKITFLGTIHATYYSSLILIFLLPLFLFRVQKALGLGAWAALGSTLIFLLIGGFQWLDSGLKSSDPLTNQFDRGSIFTQFILFEFFPQRAFLFGLIVFLATAIFAFGFPFGSKTKALRPKIVLCLILSLTALLHLHTWIAISTLLFFIFLLPPVQKSGFRKSVFILGASVALLSGLFLSFLLLRDDANASRLSWDFWLPGWAQNSKVGPARAVEMNFFYFWVFNTGFYLPLAFVGIWLKRKEKKLWAIGASGIFLFVFALFINLQPYYYDNLKLFTYAFLLLSPFAGFSLEALARSTLNRKSPIAKRMGFGIAAILVCLQVSSAVYDLGSFQNGLQKTLFFSTDEFALANQFKSVRSSPEAIVVINPRHNHWVPCLTGNPVAMGYPGWLWSWGISYGEREKQIHDILFGGPNAETLISNLHVSYAAIQKGEKVGDHAINQDFFESRFKKVIDSNGWSVYSLSERTISPSTSVR